MPTNSLWISLNRGTTQGRQRRKLRTITYQAVAPQAVAPPVAAARIRATSLLMTQLLNRGTNGNRGYNPFGGRMQVLLDAKALLVSSIRTPLSAWIASLGLIAVVTGTALVLTGHPLRSPWIVVGLAAVAALAERGRVRLTRYLEESISLLPTLFAAIVFGPLAAMFVAAASMVGAFGPPYLKWATYTCTRALTGAATGLAASWAAGVSQSHIASVVIATTVGTLVSQVMDAAFAALTLRVRRTGNPAEFLKAHVPLVFLAVPFYAPLVAVLAFAYNDVSPWTLPLFFGPALAAQRLFGLYQQERELSQSLTEVNVRLERANISFATALVATLDARDRYTAGHSAAVAIYARDIASRLGLTQDQQQLAHLCGLVHDIGKIGLPAGLLEKPGALTLEERRQMEEHSAIGERILAKVDDYAEIAKIVRHHHERIDGMGYPDGIAGDEIPLISRIIAVADAYNAMTSDRPYRDAMPSRVARMRLAQGVEGQFDTTIVAAFEAILAAATEDYRTGARLDFTLDAQDTYADQGEAEQAA
jgi:putative nucleotidyltransferase with HDIG domain